MITVPLRVVLAIGAAVGPRTTPDGAAESVFIVEDAFALLFPLICEELAIAEFPEPAGFEEVATEARASVEDEDVADEPGEEVVDAATEAAACRGSTAYLFAVTAGQLAVNRIAVASSWSQDGCMLAASRYRERQPERRCELKLVVHTLRSTHGGGSNVSVSCSVNEAGPVGGSEEN